MIFPLKLFFSLAIAGLILMAWNSNSAFAGINFAMVTEQFDRVSRARTSPLQKELIANLLSLPPTAPGLVVANAAEPFEIASAIRFARELHARAELTLLLVPSFYGNSVPGFDGIVVDRAGDVVANFSLKTILTKVGVYRLGDRLNDAVGKAIQFSLTSNWLNLFFSLNDFGDGAAIFEPRTVAAALERRYLSRPSRFFGKSRMVRDFLALFSPASGRPTWILVDGQGFVDAEFFISMVGSTPEAARFSFFGLMENDFVTVHDGGYQIESAHDENGQLKTQASARKGKLIRRCETSFQNGWQ